MKKRNKLNRITSLIALGCCGVLLILLSILNVVPTKYFIPIVIILLGLSLVNVLLSLKLKLKKKGKTTLLVLSIIITLISIVGSVYLFRTILFMGNFNFKGYSTENYSVIVLKNSSYNEIEDLENKNIGLLNGETKDEVKKHIDKEISINYKEIEDALKLKSSLYSSEVDAIVVEDTYKKILEEEDSDFASKTKVIFSFSIKTKVEDIAKSVNVTKDTFTIYIAGIDTYGTISSVSRSDVNMLVTVNPKTHQVLLTSIPRDYYVKLHDTTGYKDKLTHAGIYGVDMSVQTIEDLLDVDINYYVRVNFTSLVKLVNALGGIDVYSEYDFNSNADFEYEQGYHFSEGYNRVNGEQALAFARTRHAFVDGDRQRGKNQQAVIEALIRKAASSAIITKYTSILNSLEGSFETNLGQDDITKLAKYQIDKMPSWTVTSNSLNGSDGSEFTYSYSGQKLYVMIPNDESVNIAKDMIDQVYAGEKLESSYNGNASNVKDPGTVAPITPVAPVEETTTPEETTENNNTETNDNNVTEPNSNPSNGDSVLEEHIGDIIGSSDSQTNSQSNE